jgi:hypothetical protein
VGLMNLKFDDELEQLWLEYLTHKHLMDIMIRKVRDRKVILTKVLKDWLKAENKRYTEFENNRWGLI